MASPGDQWISGQTGTDREADGFAESRTGWLACWAVQLKHPNICLC